MIGKVNTRPALLCVAVNQKMSMSMRYWCVLFLFVFGLASDSAITRGQDEVWEIMPEVSQASLRGLYVLDADVVWASGTNGTVVHSNDQGQTWQSQVIPGAESLDIRDLHVFDRENILAMTSGTPARLYRSSDGGENWTMVFESKDPHVFLDSVSFLDNDRGLVMGDPVDGQLYLLHSTDAGWSWELVLNTPKLLPGEAGFAASGTNMTVRDGKFWVIGLGGGLPEEAKPGTHQLDQDDSATDRARVVTVDSEFSEWSVEVTPLPRHASSGIFSMVYFDNKFGVALGGDYKQPELARDHIALTNDGGETWTIPRLEKSPSGFRSCVAVARQTNETSPRLIAVGTNGTDLSSDLGQTWRRVSEIGFNAVQFSPDGRTGWAVGSDGRIAKWRD